jgi:hypothetical protein
MKKTAVVVTVAALTVLLPTLPAMGDFFSPGNINGWDATTPMVETSSGSGIWEYSWTGSSSPEIFDILATSGDWDSKVWLSGNQWVTPDAAGNTLILDANTYSDGWFPAANRVGVASESATSWTAVGDWQSQIGGADWDNANANTAMSDLGGGIYGFSATLSPGTYQYKAVVTGTWDAIGGSSRNVNSDNFEFTTAGGIVDMRVNVLDGTIQVIPEPSTIGLLGIAGLGMFLCRKKLKI